MIASFASSSCFRSHFIVSLVCTLKEDQPLRLLLNLLFYHFNRSEPTYKSPRINLLGVMASISNQSNVNALNKISVTMFSLGDLTDCIILKVDLWLQAISAFRATHYSTMQCVLSIIQFSEPDLLSVYVLYIAGKWSCKEISEVNEKIKLARIKGTLRFMYKEVSVWLKFSGGAGWWHLQNPLPPTNNFCLYPPPVLRCFWKDPLMTPTPHHPTSSTFHCYPPPHPSLLPPPKNFDHALNSKDPLISWLSALLSSDSHNSANFHLNEKNKISKSKLGSFLSDTHNILEIKQKAFVLLLIKCRTYFGTHDSCKSIFSLFQWRCQFRTEWPRKKYSGLIKRKMHNKREIFKNEIFVDYQWTHLNFGVLVLHFCCHLAEIWIFKVR